jgi:hypothetical protein
LVGLLHSARFLVYVLKDYLNSNSTPSAMWQESTSTAGGGTSPQALLLVAPEPCSCAPL